MQWSWWPVEHILRPLAPDGPRGPVGQGAPVGLLIGRYEGKCRPADIRKNKQSGTHSLMLLWHSPSVFSFKCSVGTIETHQSSSFTLPRAHTRTHTVQRSLRGVVVWNMWQADESWSPFLSSLTSHFVYALPHPASFCLTASYTARVTLSHYRELQYNWETFEPLWIAIHLCFCFIFSIFQKDS